MTTRYILIFVAGMVVTYIVLSYVSHKNIATDATWLATKKLLNTQQFSNLVRTNEFREIVKTSEFRNVIYTLAEEQLLTVAKTLQG